MTAHFRNDYPLQPTAAVNIPCAFQGCTKHAVYGLNNGEAPFWYACAEHAEFARAYGRFYRDGSEII